MTPNEEWQLLVGHGIRPGDVIADKYRLDRVIGAGGIGVVLEAWHLHLREPVAVKLLQPALAGDEEALARFEREGRAVYPMTSVHVARVIDVGRLAHSSPYIVMEYLQGCDLGRRLSEEPVLIGEAVDIVLEATEAVQCAHAIGVVHRDLKPENIFLARRPDGSESVKVLDFGVSKIPGRFSRRKRKLTGAATALGTPRYMAPELWVSARDATAAADIWALGVILFEMLADEPPFEDQEVGALCQAILRREPPPLCGRNPRVPAALAAVVSKAMAKDPRKRFAGAVELAAALQPFATARGRAAAAAVAGNAMRPRAPERPVQDEAERATEGWQSGDHDRSRASRVTAAIIAIAALAMVGAAVLIGSGPGEEPAPSPPAAQPNAEPSPVIEEAAIEPTAAATVAAPVPSSPPVAVKPRSSGRRQGAPPPRESAETPPAPLPPPIGDHFFGKM